MSSRAYSNANTHSNHFSARRLFILWDIEIISKPRLEIVSSPEQPRVIQSIVLLSPMVVSLATSQLMLRVDGHVFHDARKGGTISRNRLIRSTAHEGFPFSYTCSQP